MNSFPHYTKKEITARIRRNGEREKVLGSNYRYFYIINTEKRGSEKKCGVPLKDEEIAVL